MKFRRTALAASLALMALGSPLLTGCGAQTTIAEGASNQAAESDSADRRALKDEITELTKLIETNPQYAYAYYNCGTTKGRELGDYKGAIADYSKAIEINPQYADYYTNRGITRENIGDQKGACADWRKATSLGDKDAAEWVRKQC